MQVRPVSKTVIWLAVGMVLFSMLPALTGFLEAKGQWFLPYGYSFDDQMVYQAWIHQAAEGNLRFSNRFTFDADPGLTINLFFLALGQISKLAGGVGADLLARGGGTALLVLALYRLVFRFSPDSASRKSAMMFAILGGGFGALVWHHYGRGVVRPSPFGSLLGPGLPVDVWQPEIFVFPSMLTTSLFVVSLALVVTAFVSVIDAAENPNWPWAGTLAMAVLMNIHSYDVLIIGLVLLGLLVMLITGKSLTSAYVVRVLQICAGILPAAIYYIYVIKNDPVFAARAATPTHTSSFRELALGLGPLLVMGCVWVGLRVGRFQALALGSTLMLALAFAQPSAEAYGLTPVTWLLVLVGVLAWLGWSGRELSLVEKLVLAWAVMGLLAPYFPALFQRKLAAGLAIPWGILAGDALVRLYQMKGNGRPFAALGLAGMFIGIVGMWNWLSREMVYIRGNVSRTTVNALVYPVELKGFVSELSKHPGTKIIAPPGVPNSVGIDEFSTPLITDLNPLFTGMAGARTYAGHWSETPDYLTKRNESAAIFFVQTSEDAVREFLDRTQPNYLCAPTGNEVFRDFSGYGETVASAPGWVLIRLR